MTAKPPSAQTKVVPIEPTEEMIDVTKNVVSSYACKKIWEAMLAAAPADSGAAQALAVAWCIRYDDPNCGPIHSNPTMYRPEAEAFIARASSRLELVTLFAAPPQGFRDDAERYQWMLNEPEGARHLLSLLQQNKGDKVSFSKMIDRIRASEQSALAAREGEK